MDNFGKQDESGSILKIQVGLDIDGGLSNAGGHLSDIRLFSEAGEFLGGGYDQGFIEDGTKGEDIKIKQDSEQQATYALFTANDNAICVAYVSIVWPDGQKFGWTGDWAEMCDFGTWYYSNIFLGQLDHKKPACMWIDGDGDQPVTAFQVHFPEFYTTDSKLEPDKDHYCRGGPTLSVYHEKDPNHITYWTPDGKQSNQKTKRESQNLRHGTTIGEAWNSTSWNSTSGHHSLGNETLYSNDPRLVISHDISQSAAQLCASVPSLGPDFLNVAEGLFCNMRTKTLYPVCDEELGRIDNCFDAGMRKLVVGGIHKRDVDYLKVIDWNHGS